MIDDLNTWETDPVPVTEKEKKELARQRISSELEGNPNLPKKRTKKIRFKPPTPEEKQRMEYLDRMGNPIKGYKWVGLDIVEIATDKIVFKSKVVKEEVKQTKSTEIEYKGRKYVVTNHLDNA